MGNSRNAQASVENEVLITRRSSPLSTHDGRLVSLASLARQYDFEPRIAVATIVGQRQTSPAQGAIALWGPCADRYSPLDIEVFFGALRRNSPSIPARSFIHNYANYLVSKDALPISLTDIMIPKNQIPLLLDAMEIPTEHVGLKDDSGPTPKSRKRQSKKAQARHTVYIAAAKKILDEYSKTGDPLICNHRGTPNAAHIWHILKINPTKYLGRVKLPPTSRTFLSVVRAAVRAGVL